MQRPPWTGTRRECSRRSKPFQTKVKMVLMFDLSDKGHWYKQGMRVAGVRQHNVHGQASCRCISNATKRLHCLVAVCIPAFVPTPFRRSAFPHFPQKRPCDCRAPEGGTPETKTASHAQKSGSTKRPNAGEQLTKDFAGHRKRWKSVACHVGSLVRGC